MVILKPQSKGKRADRLHDATCNTHEQIKDRIAPQHRDKYSHNYYDYCYKKLQELGYV